MTGPKSQKILITEDVIREYIQSLAGYKVSRKMFQRYIDLRLPVVLIAGKYHAHADNIDRFFQQMTQKQMLDGEETDED